MSIDEIEHFNTCIETMIKTSISIGLVLSIVLVCGLLIIDRIFNG